MTFIRNESGQSVIDAVLTVAIVLLIVLFFVIGFGLFLDTYVWEITDLIGSVSPRFLETVQATYSFLYMFWLTPTIFLLLITVWLYKYIVKKMYYTRREEEEEW